MKVHALAIGANPKAALRCEETHGLPGELGSALVLKENNGAPLFRLALTVSGEFQVTPLTDAITVRMPNLGIMESLLDMGSVLRTMNRATDMAAADLADKRP